MNPVKRKAYIRLIILGAILFVILTAGAIDRIFIKKNPDTEGISIHYIDVGEADSALILCGRDAMLIDGGEELDEGYIYAYLKKHKIKELKYLICTHSDEDHVGGLCGALKAVRTDNVYAPEAGAETKPYKDFIELIEKKNIPLSVPKPGETFTLGDADGVFLGPVYAYNESANNNSIVLKITYKERSFLFTGDAEYPEEFDILQSGADISADVLKVPHHGSASSYCEEFTEKVDPLFAVISVGADNEYGHPSERVTDYLTERGVEILRTDESGTIIMNCDGNHINFQTEKGKEE